jgi:hypothetical protein
MSNKRIEFLGKRLLRASQAVYPFPDVLDEGPPLELEFTDRSVLVFDLESDGQSVSVGSEPLPFPEARAGYDVWVRKEIDAPLLVGKLVTRIDALVEKGEDWQYVAAWRVWLESSFICFANIGDSSVVGIDETPEGFEGSWATLHEVQHA